MKTLTITYEKNGDIKIAATNLNPIEMLGLLKASHAKILKAMLKNDEDDTKDKV